VKRWSSGVLLLCCAPCMSPSTQYEGKHITHLAVCCAVLCCPLVCLLASASIVLYTHGLAVNLAAAHTTCYMIHPFIFLPINRLMSQTATPATARPYTSLTCLGPSTPDAYSHHIPHATAIHSTSPASENRAVQQCSSAAQRTSSSFHSIQQTSPGTLQPLVSLQPHFIHPLHCRISSP
jgi:hypothetical protein